jgi:Ankyrin repeat
VNFQHVIDILATVSEGSSRDAVTEDELFEVITDAYEIIIIQLFIQDKLVSNRLVRESDQFAVDDNGFTLLMMAATMGSLNTMKFLLKQKDAPVNAQHTKVG